MKSNGKTISLASALGKSLRTPLLFSALAVALISTSALASDPEDKNAADDAVSLAKAPPKPHLNKSNNLYTGSNVFTNTADGPFFKVSNPIGSFEYDGYLNTAGGAHLLGAFTTFDTSWPQVRFTRNQPGSPYMDIGQNQNGDFVVQGNDVSVLTVGAGGNVGIGTETPVTALQVVGTVTATSFAGDGTGITNVSANSWYFGIVVDNTIITNGNAIIPESVHGKGISCDGNGVFTFQNAGWYKFDVQLSGDAGGGFYNSGTVNYDVDLGNAVPDLERDSDSNMSWFINPDPMASQPYTTTFVQHFSSGGQTCQFINQTGNKLFLGTGLSDPFALGGRITISQIDNP